MDKIVDEGIDILESVVYKKRILLSILLCLFALLLNIYFVAREVMYFSWLSIPLIAFLNGEILGNRTGLNNKEKIILVVSYVVIACIFVYFIYNWNLTKLLKNNW